MPAAKEPAYQLFWEAMSGAMVVELLLEELGVGYRSVAIDMARGQHRTAEYLALNPTGQVPALMLPDGTVVGESAAIVALLGERHPESPLVPATGAADRPAFLRWLLYIAASPYMTFVQFNHPERFSSDEAALPDLVANARARLLAQFSLLNDAGSGPAFLKSDLSALDLYLFMLIEFYPDRDALLAGRPALSSLHAAVAERPSARLVLPRHRRSNEPPPEPL